MDVLNGFLNGASAPRNVWEFSALLVALGLPVAAWIRGRWLP